MLQVILGDAFMTRSGQPATAGQVMSSFFGSWLGPSRHIGKNATASTALTIAAFYNGVDQISNDIAKTPWKVYEKTQDGRSHNSIHPVDRVLNLGAADTITPFHTRKCLILSAIIKGDGFARIRRNNAGEVFSLSFIEYQDVHQIKKFKGKLYYQLKGMNGLLPQEDMLHIPGFSFNGIRGISVIEFAAQNMGITLNAQNFASNTYDNKALTQGVLTTEQEIKKELKPEVANRFAKALSEKALNRAAVLDKGMKYERISLTPAELQFIETYNFGISDIARWLNIAPHKLKDLSKANYSSLDLMSVEHQQDCILPWMIKLEQEANRKMFLTSDRGRYYTKFTTNATLRTDVKAKADFYGKMVLAGIMTRNEVRKLEELNELDGLSDPLTPVNVFTPAQIEAKTKESNE